MWLTRLVLVGDEGAEGTVVNMMGYDQSLGPAELNACVCVHVLLPQSKLINIRFSFITNSMPLETYL